MYTTAVELLASSAATAAGGATMPCNSPHALCVLCSAVSRPGTCRRGGLCVRTTDTNGSSAVFGCYLGRCHADLMRRTATELCPVLRVLVARWNGYLMRGLPCRAVRGRADCCILLLSSRPSSASCAVHRPALFAIVGRARGIVRRPMFLWRLALALCSLAETVRCIPCSREIAS